MTETKREWTQEQAAAIIGRLKEKGVPGKCPMCSVQNFVLMTGYFTPQVISQVLPGLPAPGGNIPSVAIICENCGFISQHAIGALDLDAVVGVKK